MIIFSALGQTQSVMVSDAITFKSDFKYEVLPTASGRVLIFKDEGFEQNLLCYDSNMVTLWNKPIEFEKKRVGLIGLVPQSDHFWVYYYFREQQDIYILSRKYNERGDMVSSDTIIREQYIQGLPIYYFAVSPQKETAMIFTVDEDEKVDAYGIDISDNKLIWVRSITHEEVSIKHSFKELLLSDDGRAFFLFEIDNSWSKRRKHRFELLRLGDSNERVEISSAGRLTYDISMKFGGEQKKIFVTQTFTNRSNNRCNGINSWVVSLGQMEVHADLQLDFEEDLPSNPNLDKVDTEKGISDLALRHVVPRVDGGSVIICESSKEYTRRPGFTSSASVTRRWVDYYFEDIIVFSLNPGGALDWFEVLHKKQYSQDDDASYSSFFLFKVPAQLRMVYNDEIKKGNTVSEYLITSNGLQERKSLMSTDHQNLKLKFREAVQINNHEILVPSLQANQIKLVKIEYDKFTIH